MLVDLEPCGGAAVYGRVDPTDDRQPTPGPADRDPDPYAVRRQPPADPFLEPWPPAEPIMNTRPSAEPFTFSEADPDPNPHGRRPADPSPRRGRPGGSPFRGAASVDPYRGAAAAEPYRRGGAPADPFGGGAALADDPLGVDRRPTPAFFADDRVADGRLGGPSGGDLLRPDGEPGAGGSGRHRGRRRIPVPLMIGVAVAALLTAFAAVAAMWPSRDANKAADPPGYVDQARIATEAAADPTNEATAGAGEPAAPAPPGPRSAAPPGPAAGANPVPAAKPAPAAKPKPRATTAPRKPTPAKPTSRRPTPPKVGPGQEAQEAEVIRLSNVERDKAGCDALTLNTALRTAIRLHVEEVGTHGDLYLSHDSDDGRSFVDRAKAQGYDSPGGENVARGQRDAADVMDSWMTSAGHRDNILNCSFKAIGVGMAKGVDGTLVWGQIFGRS
jgi:uncharacterized protein YkwD